MLHFFEDVLNLSLSLTLQWTPPLGVDALLPGWDGRKPFGNTMKLVSGVKLVAVSSSEPDGEKMKHNLYKMSFVPKVHP